jgi:hypothetical protein
LCRTRADVILGETKGDAPMTRFLNKIALAGAGMWASIAAAPAAAQSLPSPVLYLTGQEYYSANGKNWIRYRYDVLNKGAYPAALFAAAPALPPCGNNTNSSRSWVDFFDNRGKRLYGFCALGSPQNLGSLWFSVEEGTVPPSWVYIEIHDRQTGTKIKSNLADTTL